MILPALLLLMLSAPPPGPDDASAPLVCDDGGSPWSTDGSPNWDCTLDGCSPHDMVCGEERLDHCRDEAQPDVDHCAYSTIECHSKWSCFDLWVGCPGEYKCLDEESWIGCDHAQCKTGRRLLIDLPLTAPAHGNKAPAPRPRAPLRVFTPTPRLGRAAAPVAVGPPGRGAAKSRVATFDGGHEIDRRGKPRPKKSLARRAGRPLR